MFPRVDNKTIRLVAQSGPWIRFPGDETRSLGTPPGRNLGQQITAQSPCPHGILRVQADTWSMVTRHTPHFIHIGGRRLWRQVHQQSRRRPFDRMPEGELQLHPRLGQRPLLRNKIEMGLRRKNPRHINAGIHTQVTPEIQT